MNFLFDCVGAGFKGAVIKFFKMIFFILIVLIVVYIVGIFTSKKASALTYKGQSYSSYTSSNTKTGTLNAGQGSVDLTYVLSNQAPVNSSLLGFRLNSFNVEYSSYTNGHNISCSGYYNVNNNPQAVNVQSGLSFTCTDLDTNLPLADTNYLITINANVIQLDRNNNDNQYQSPCWKSSEYQDTLICPNNKDDKLYGILITLRYNSPVDIFYRVDLTGNKFLLAYDNDDVINQNGVIISQQQQQQQYLEDNNTSTSQNNSTSALSNIQQNMNTKLKGTNELTQMVMAPLTSLISISSTTCQPITWNIPLVNYTATIPCMSTIYNQYFSAVITLFATIITGVYSYRTIVKLVSTIKDALDAESDKLEVLDL